MHLPAECEQGNTKYVWQLEGAEVLVQPLRAPTSLIALSSLICAPTHSLPTRPGLY